MTITSVKIRKLLNDGRMKAVVSITIDEEFAVHDIKIIEGDNGLFIAMPSRKDETGAFRDILHPIDDVTRNYMTSVIIERYKKIKDNLNMA